MEDARTLAQLAREAIDIQSACNLSGLVHGWSRSARRLRELLKTAGTDEINHHPVNQLWADKLYDLTGMAAKPDDAQTVYATALFACQDLLLAPENSSAVQS